MLLRCFQWQHGQVALLLLWILQISEVVRKCSASLNNGGATGGGAGSKGRTNKNHTRTAGVNSGAATRAASGSAVMSNRVLPCPSGCNCTDGLVDCQGLNLSTIPLSLPAATAVLKMANNKMRKLSNDSFTEIRGVERLFLEFNHIQRIEEGTFQRTLNVQVLHLQGNSLTSLHRRVFAGLYHLRHLYLHDNGLSTLEPTLFMDTVRLHVLDLRANQLRTLPNRTFSSLVQLTRLNLAQNPLRQPLESALFNEQRSLELLNLGATGLSSVHAKLLQPLVKLESLLLDRNKFTRFHIAPFFPLHALRHLNVSHNPFICDCHMRRFHTWITNGSSAVSSPNNNYSTMKLEFDEYSSPRCHIPSKYRGMLVSSLVHSNLTCPRRKETWRKHYHWYTYRHNNVVNPEPLPYDKMMGWYTAATLSGMLVLFLIGVALDMAKRRFFRWRRAKREERERLQDQLQSPPPLLRQTPLQSVEMKNCGGGPSNRKPKLVPTNSINSANSLTLANSHLNSALSSMREITIPPDTLNFVSRQSSCDGGSGPGMMVGGPKGVTSGNASTADILKRNNLMQGRTPLPPSPLPKVEIHLAPNLHDLANFHNPHEYLLKPHQDILIDVSSDNISNVSSNCSGSIGEKNSNSNSAAAESKFLLWPANHAKLNKLQKQVETSL